MVVLFAAAAAAQRVDALAAGVASETTRNSVGQVEACIARALDNVPLAVSGAERMTAEVAARVRCRKQHAQAEQSVVEVGGSAAREAGNASWPPFEVGPMANARREDYCAVERQGAPFASSEKESGAVGEASKVYHQFAFSSDGHSFAVDAYLHDAGLGETGRGGVYGDESDSVFVGTRPVTHSSGSASGGNSAAGRDSGSGSDGVVAIILSSDLAHTPAPMPLRCRFESVGGRAGAPIDPVETLAELQLFGTRYAPRPKQAHEDIEAYTILCPAPASFLRDAVGPAPRRGSEGRVVTDASLSLVYDARSAAADGTPGASGPGRVETWMQPLTFRDMRMPITTEPAAPAVDLAMCLSGVFGIGGGRFLPEYIEYHRALGVGLFEVRARCA